MMRISIILPIVIPKEIPINVINIFTNIFRNIKLIHRIFNISISIDLIRTTLPAAERV